MTPIPAFPQNWHYLDQLLMCHIAAEESLLIVHKPRELRLFYFLSI